MLPCRCSCVTELVAIPLTATLESVWPHEDRQAGVVFVDNESTQCYQFVGYKIDPPSWVRIIDPSDYTTVPDCSGPCAGDPGDCLPPPGHVTFAIGFSPSICRAGADISCLTRARLRVESHGYNYFERADRFGEPLSEVRGTASLVGEVTRVPDGQGGSEVTSGNYILTSQGYRYTSTGGREDVNIAFIEPEGNSSYVQSFARAYDPRFGTWGLFGGICSVAYDQGTSGPVICPAPQVVTAGPGLDPCDETLREDFDDGGYYEETRYRRSTPGNGYEYWAHRLRPGAGALDPVSSQGSSFQRITVLSFESVDGRYSMEFDECGEPSARIAVACDKDAEPLQIAYDPADIVDDSILTIIDPATDQRYVPTSQETPDDPVEFVPSPDECPGDPDPDDNIYRINRCGSTQRAVGAAVVGDTLEGRTIGYRPGDGLRAGEGRVVYEGSDGQCLARLAGQPTTQVLDEEPDIILTSEAGSCVGYPIVRIDPRPGCQDQPGGGGGPGGTGSGRPSDPNDPAIIAEIARQQQARTGQYPGRCPSCGG